MNRVFVIVPSAIVTLALAACGPSGSGSTDRAIASHLTAATLGDQAILSSQEYLEQPQYASADVGRGELLSTQCRACHTLEAAGAAIVGPNLFGIFGRPAGHAADYAYSEVLANSGIVWTPRALDAWLAQPFSFLPGTRMSFPVLSQEQDRNALIAYLLKYTDGGDGE